MLASCQRPFFRRRGCRPGAEPFSALPEDLRRCRSPRRRAQAFPYKPAEGRSEPQCWPTAHSGLARWKPRDALSSVARAGHWPRRRSDAVGGVSGGCQEAWLCKVDAATRTTATTSFGCAGRLPATPDRPPMRLDTPRAGLRCVASSRDAGEHAPPIELGCGPRAEVFGRGRALGG
jgi:hypothetical protein